MTKLPLLVGVLTLSGCAVLPASGQRPYPTGWPEVGQFTQPCDAVAGNYESGIVPADSDLPDDFSIIAGPDTSFPIGQANHVTVVRAPGSITVTYLQNDTQLGQSIFSEAGGTLTCSPDGAKIVNDQQRTEMFDRKHEAYEHRATYLRKATDGSLIVKVDYSNIQVGITIAPAHQGGEWARFPASP